MRVSVTPCRAPVRLLSSEEAFQIGKLLRIDADSPTDELSFEWQQSDNVPAVWLPRARALCWVQGARRSSKRRPVPGDAADLFEVWHAREPKMEYTIQLPSMPLKWHKVGRVHRIDYASDKWNAGKTIEYTHEVSNGTTLYLAEFGGGKRLWLCRGRLTVTDRGLEN